jgi:hypothetical protein
MVMSPLANQDMIWGIFSKALLENKFPSCIISVKMSMEDTRTKSGDLVNLNVVTGDFLNEGEVFEADRAIAELLFRHVPVDSVKCMKYKVRRTVS